MQQKLPHGKFCYLPLCSALLRYQLVKHGPVILINLLHLIDVARYLLHCFQRFCQVVVLLTVVVRQGHQLPEQQWVLEHPLHGLDEVGLQRGRVLLSGVPGIQEGLEGVVRFGSL